MQFHRALAEVEQGHRTHSDQQQSRAIRNDDVVAHLTPRFTGRSQARTGVLHKRLDQVARLRRLAFGQAGVTRHALAHRTPHGRVVAWLHLSTLSVGLVFVLGIGVSAWRQLKNVGAFHTQAGFSLGSRRGGSRSWRLGNCTQRRHGEPKSQ